MKFIFDFDDVLFYNTAKFKPYMYKVLKSVGISEEIAQVYYTKVRHNFSCKNYVSGLINKLDRKDLDVGIICEDIMKECPNFVNDDLRKLALHIGKENSYVVTHGDKDYQLEKIKRSGLDSLFLPSHIFTTTTSKSEHIDNICEENKEDSIVFIDDKAHHFENLNIEKCKNLKTILYTGQDLSSYFQ